MKQTTLKTPTSRCRAGLSWTDVTPPVGIYHRFWGAAAHDRAAGVHRPLRATVLLLAADAMKDAPLSETSILVALDHCLLRPDDMDELRAKTAALIGVADDRLLFTFSHTHSGGHIARSRSNLPGGELIGPYLDGLPQRIADACNAAHESLQPVTITYAQTDCRMGRNRDYWDSELQTHVCGTNPDVELPLPVTVARLTDAAGDVIGTVVNYPCHPTTLAWDNELISPDYVGAMRETVEAATNAPCLFLLAPCGDVGPGYGFVGETEAADQNGRELGYAALSALESMPPAGNDVVYTGPVISGATIGVWKRSPHDTARIRSV
ncbi:MAG: hypothetical protein IID45_00280 [Planctomycetes bacterium]|nr:hypothetical protein [Planctomycetota bacterium]